MATVCTTFALGITLDEEGDVVVIAIAGQMDEAEPVAQIPLAPSSAIHIAHQLAVLASEARMLQVRMEGMSLDEKMSAVEDILKATQAEQN